MDGYSQHDERAQTSIGGFSKLDPRLMNPPKAVGLGCENAARRAGPLSALIKANMTGNEQLADAVIRLTDALIAIEGPTSPEGDLVRSAGKVGQEGEYVGALNELSMCADIRQGWLHRLNALVTRVEALR